MSLMRFAFAGIAGVFLTASATLAAPHNPNENELLARPSAASDLELVDVAVAHSAYFPFFGQSELDRLKNQAAIKGIVLMAAMSVNNTSGEAPAKSKAMRQTEEAILGINVPLVTAVMILASGALMWMCAGLQRERL